MQGIMELTVHSCSGKKATQLSRLGRQLFLIQLPDQARLESGTFVSMNNSFAYCLIYITYGQHHLLLCRFFPGIG